MPEITIKSIVDSITLNSNKPNENISNYNKLFLGNLFKNIEFRNILKFDISNITNINNIEKVKLLLYIWKNDNISYEKKYTLHPIENEYDKNSINFNNQPKFSSSPISSFSILDEVTTWINIDITELFKIWCKNQDKNYGLVIKSINNRVKSLIGFYSKDHLKYSPKLKVIFNKKNQRIDKKSPANPQNKTSKELFASANKYYLKKVYKKAIPLYEDSLNLYKEEIDYHKGMCFLYTKDYKNAYNSFCHIKEGKFYKESIYMSILCECLNNNLGNLTKLLDSAKNFDDFYRFKVYYAFCKIIENDKSKPLSDNEKESLLYSEHIFDLLELLLNCSTPEIFEKSLELLNLIENNEVLLRLGKLYYKNDFCDLSYKEFIRSIKLFDIIDTEALNIMKDYLIMKDD
ncbi:DNRLRE domain-containing protein [Dethiothermospora halolimnae]|uniref:DNRLRE domain-containing protein n=1 Tax=Dethiothermospora halolimnae TaxID=3114390 RepID=UPI003CCBF9CE